MREDFDQRSDLAKLTWNNTCEVDSRVPKINNFSESSNNKFKGKGFLDRRPRDFKGLFINLEAYFTEYSGEAEHSCRIEFDPYKLFYDLLVKNKTTIEYLIKTFVLLDGKLIWKLDKEHHYVMPTSKNLSNLEEIENFDSFESFFDNYSSHVVVILKSNFCSCAKSMRSGCCVHIAYAKYVHELKVFNVIPQTLKIEKSLNMSKALEMSNLKRKSDSNSETNRKLIKKNIKRK